MNQALQVRLDLQDSELMANRCVKNRPVETYHKLNGADTEVHVWLVCMIIKAKIGKLASKITEVVLSHIDFHTK